jgi:AraC-like DNA-binding protein
MLTAKAAIPSSIKGVESGADFYFTKPLNLELLQLTIRNIFEQNKKIKDRFVKDYYSEAKENVHSVKDKEFMDELVEIIDTQLVNPDLDIDYLCSKVGMSRTKLYQKIKNITGQSIGEFIRTIRLKKAAYIMTHEDVPLSEIMYRIGIQTQSYFTKAFKKEFGKTPTQFMQELKQ